MVQNAPAEPLGRFAALRTQDADEAEHVVADVYVPHRLAATAAPLDARLNVVRCGALTLGYLAYGGDVRLQVPPMVDSFHLNLTLAGTTTVRQGRAEVRTDAQRSGALLSPTQPSTLDWSADAAQFALKIDRRALETQLSGLLHDAVSRPVRFSLGVDLDTPGGAALLTATRFLAAQLELQEHADGLVRRHLESFVLTQLLLSVPNSYSRSLAAAAGSGPVGRSALEDAVDYVEAHPERPLDVADLAAVVGTSAAALRAAFRRELGTTPEAYVREVRLARAHAELTASPDAAPLSALARRWGFARVDRFTAAYAARYGHHPAEALHGARGHAARGGHSPARRG